MIPYKLNFDYEYQLFKSNAKKLPFDPNMEFSPFYFYSKDASVPLLSLHKFTDEYLDSVLRMTGTRPSIITESKSFNYWWGDLKDIEIEKMFNSKKVTSEWGRQIDACHSSVTIVESEELLKSVIEQDKFKKWIIRSDFLMSGRGVFVVDPTLPIPKNIHYPAVASLLLERVIDIGTYVNSPTDFFSYFNLVDERGTYRGTINFKDDDNFLQILGKYYPQVLTEFCEKRKSIIKMLYEKGASRGFSIDSFIYRNESQYRLYALSEVNYRKTMGYCAQECSLLFPQADFCLLRLENKRRHTPLNDQVIISPTTNQFVISVTPLSSVETYFRQ